MRVVFSKDQIPDTYVVQDISFQYIWHSFDGALIIGGIIVT